MSRHGFKKGMFAIHCDGFNEVAKALTRLRGW
jgi:hypothetical protein